MIRELRKTDINIVADIWLYTNIKAHYFIPAQYCKGYKEQIAFKCISKNIPAISFYQREGFEIQYSGLDEATGEKDYVMVWQQK